jgi:hypothetical protein
MLQFEGESFVPRNQDEIDLLISQRPDFWEYRLFAGVLTLQAAALDSKYEDYLLGYAPRSGVAIYEAQFTNFLKMQLDELRVLGDNFKQIFNTTAGHAERAFGPPGVQGEPRWRPVTCPTSKALASRS